MSVVITLSPGELAVAQTLASLRRCVNQANGVTDARRDRAQQAIELDLLGTVSELAWAKYLNQYPDLSVNPRRGGSDYVSPTDSPWPGMRVDIKATKRRDGRLLATTNKKSDDAHIYVLAVVDENEVTFVGWAKSEELLVPATLKDLGYGPTHALDQSQLRPMEMA